MTLPLKVLKFGGTSVGAADRLHNVAAITREAAETHRPVVVASAASGVTDELVEAWRQREEDALDEHAFTQRIRRRYTALAREALTPVQLPRYARVLDAGELALRTILRAVSRYGVTPAFRDEWLAAGERLSVPLVALVLEQAGLQARPYDATDLIRTDDTYGEADVDLSQTRLQIQRWYRLLASTEVPVVTGFIGATGAGATTTLGRGGSDYSAALLASALGAEVLERWTDVDGIYTDDPRKNEQAKRLACIVLEEAWAWNHAGRLGMHRKALDPLVEARVPVHVRSTAAPDLPGTLILPADHPQTVLANAS